MTLPSNPPCVCTRMSCGAHVYIYGCATALVPWRLQMIYHFPFRGHRWSPKCRHAVCSLLYRMAKSTNSTQNIPPLHEGAGGPA